MPCCFHFQLNAQAEFTCGLDLLKLESKSLKEKPLTYQNTLEQRSNDVIYIRTVIHDLYNEYESELIPDSVFTNIIDVVNNNLDGQNMDLSLIDPSFHNVIGESKIQLCLAKKDPFGNHTNGIIHKTTSEDEFSFSFTEDSSYIPAQPWQSSRYGSRAWDPTRYLNIWIAKLHFIGGFGIPYPNAYPLAHLTTGKFPGITINRSIIISAIHSNTDAMARLITHELGHCFGLFHTWGATEEFDKFCEVDDFIDDTPTCTPGGVCRSEINTCEEERGEEILLDNISNFMGYSCAQMFTKDQAKLINNNIRFGLPDIQITNSECEQYNNFAIPMNIAPNPNHGDFTLQLYRTTQSEVNYYIYHINGAKISSGTIPEDTESWVIKPDSNMHNGIYILALEGGNYNGQQKFIVH